MHSHSLLRPTLEMRSQLSIALACFALGAAVPKPTHAARPMIPDAARIVDPQACQLESWARKNEHSTEYWAIPACNPTGNLELAFGGARTNEAGETHTSDVQLQAKTIFRPLKPNDWGVGVAVGSLRHPNAASRSFGSNLYGYVPLSVSFADDLAVLHVNAGVLRPEESAHHHPIFGIGGEIRLHPRLFFIPEVFHQEEGRPKFQAGLRMWIVPQRFQIDATYGDRVGGGGGGGGQQWFSIGVRLISPSL
jgi:hypothetical protein